MPDQLPSHPGAEPTAGRPNMASNYGVDPAATGSMIPWATVTEKIEAARNYWVATTRPDGRPHTMPVWGLWLNGALWFSTDPASVKGRNLAINPAIVVHLESGDDVVILEGAAERTGAEAVPGNYADAYEAKYQFRPDVNDPAGAVYRLHPTTAFAWREQDFLESATRWRFA